MTDALDTRLHAARDAQVEAATAAGFGRSTVLTLAGIEPSVEHDRSRRYAVVGAVSLAAACAAAVVAVTHAGTGTDVPGRSLSGPTSALAASSVPTGDTCRAGAPTAADGELPTSFFNPQAPSGYNNPDAAFYASLPTAPAALDQTMRVYAVAEEHRRIAQHEFIEQPGTFSAQNISFLEFGYLRSYLVDPGFPAAEQPVVAALLADRARSGGGVISSGPITFRGCAAVGYTNVQYAGFLDYPLVFDRAGRFLGAPRVLDLRGRSTATR